MISRQPPGVDLWTVLWPATQQAAAMHQCADWRGFSTAAPNGGALPRISDHRPTVANLELSILRQPGRYQPDWTHIVDSRVTSVDVSAEVDCILDICSPADPYVELVGYRFTSTEERQAAPGEIKLRSQSCDNRAAGSLYWPRFSCMDNWVNRTPPIAAGEYRRHETAWRLWEKDDSSGDELLPTIGPVGGGALDDHPNFRVLWNSNQFDISPQIDRSQNPPRWSGPTPILSSDPIRWCTSDRSPNICVRTTLEEVP